MGDFFNKYFSFQPRNNMNLAKSDNVKSYNVGIVFSLPNNSPPKVHEIIRNSVADDNKEIRLGLYLASINDVPVKPTIDSKELENILAAATASTADSISLGLFDDDGELITVSLPLSWEEKKRRAEEADLLRHEKLMNVRPAQLQLPAVANTSEIAKIRREENLKLYELGKRLQAPQGGKKRTIRKKNRKGTRRATRATRANQRKNRRMRKNSRKSRNAQ